jgi:hypothetical protein
MRWLRGTVATPEANEIPLKCYKSTLARKDSNIAGISLMSYECAGSCLMGFLPGIGEIQFYILILSILSRVFNLPLSRQLPVGVPPGYRGDRGRHRRH